MKVVCYPSDDYGCGSYRIIWPAEVLKAAGHDVTVVRQQDRNIRITMKDGNVHSVDINKDIDVVIFQRTTDRRLLPVISYLRNIGIAVIIDIDDDLSSIHPHNPAWVELDPNRALREVKAAVASGRIKQDKAGQIHAMLSSQYTHSWNNLKEACHLATLVTVSTPGLVTRYGGPDKCYVLFNYIPEWYLNVEHKDDTIIGWPAALHSHPDDPSAVGNSISRVMDEGNSFRCIGDLNGVMKTFGMNQIPECIESVSIEDWPHELAKLGIGIAPLSETLFNQRKSWLKPLELSACGVPWVASPRNEYRRLHNMGAGILAEKPKIWYRELKQLTNDKQKRKELSEAGRNVASQLCIENHAWRWMEIWEKAMNIQQQVKTTV